MRSWLNILAIGIWLIASWPCMGKDALKVYEIELEEQSADIVEIQYYIEPASVPLEIDKYIDFDDWITTSNIRYFSMSEVKNNRVVMFFQFNTRVAQTVYFNYWWASPLKNARFVVVDEMGNIIETKMLRQHNPRWSSYVLPGRYKVLFFMEFHLFSDAKSLMKIQNSSYMNGKGLFMNEVTTFIYGIGISFIIFNFSMFLLNRRPYFIYYVGYSLTILYLLAVSSSHAPMPSAILWSASLILNALFAVLMSGSVLRLKEYNSLLYRVSLSLIAISIFLVFLHYLSELNALLLSGYIIGLSTYFICVYASIRRMIAGYIPAVFLAAGWGILFLGYLLSFVNIYIMDISILYWSAFFAYALESILFAIALAYRTRDSEQRAVKDKMHALSQLQKVVYPHQMEQIKSGFELEGTMPTDSGHACVLSFDIIGSSKIKHIRSKEFFRNVFTRCNSIMSEGYDGTNLKANAYRVKEMGDGFLCSVGYPFKSMTANPANESIDLAKRFVQVLVEEAQILHAETAISCGVGIALDALTGFYPENGTKEYDIYGQAMVLATRYERMRKTLFEGEKGRSVIIIQEVVYQSLDPSHRTGFIAMDLKELRLVVRDDPAATKLYYQFLDSQQILAATTLSQMKAV